MSYLLPAASPATTKLVFFDTLPDTFAPRAFSAAPASSRFMPLCVRLPVNTNVSPSSVCGSASAASASTSSARRTPCFANRSMTCTLSGVRRNRYVECAIFGPTPSTAASCSSVAAISASMLGNARASVSAMVLPTWRIPSPNSGRANGRVRDSSMAATSFFATVCPRQMGSPSLFVRPVCSCASSTSSSV